MIKRTFLIFLIFIIFSVLFTVTFTEGKEKNLDITSLAINFDKKDAIFTVNYDLGDLPRLYILIIGSKELEPKIKSIFSNFDYEIIKMNEYKAVLRVKNISRFDKGYYLYDYNTKFGEGIKELDIYIPGSLEPKKYSNIYIFDWDNVPGMDDYNLINFLKKDIGLNWSGDLKIFKGLDNKSVIGIVEKLGNKSIIGILDHDKEKLFEITLDKNKMISILYVNNEQYDLLAVKNNDKIYIFSPRIYSIPNIFYR